MLEFRLPSAPSIIVFTTTSDGPLGEFLEDGYNFEVSLRHLELDEQVSVHNNKHDPVKALVLRAFTKIVLNYCLHLTGASEVFDPWQHLVFEHNEFGKPSLKNQKFQFNSSSSNSVMSMAVQFNAETPVGIDLSHQLQESISPTDFLEQFEGIFSENERVQLAKELDIAFRYTLFNQFWTLKEAFTKFLGCGLNIDLSSFSFNISETELIARDVLPKMPKNWDILQVQWQQGITVDTSGLDQALQESLTNKKVTCLSGVLRNGPGLPVICSLIHQLDDVPIKMVYIDLGSYFNASYE